MLLKKSREQNVTSVCAALRIADKNSILYLYRNNFYTPTVKYYFTDKWMAQTWDYANQDFDTSVSNLLLVSCTTIKNHHNWERDTIKKRSLINCLQYSSWHNYFSIRYMIWPNYHVTRKRIVKFQNIFSLNINHD